MFYVFNASSIESILPEDEMTKNSCCLGRKDSFYYVSEVLRIYNHE